MHPAGLWRALMVVVAAIEVTAEHAIVVLADQLFDHFSSTRMTVLVIANARGIHRPDVAIDALFSPPRFISLDCRTGPDRPFERIYVGLQVYFDPVQQLNNLSTADPDPVHREQVRLALSNRQPHDPVQT